MPGLTSELQHEPLPTRSPRTRTSTSASSFGIHFSFFTVNVAGGVISFSPFVYCERGPGPSDAPYIMIIRRHQHDGATCKRSLASSPRGAGGRVVSLRAGGGRAHASKLQHEIGLGYKASNQNSILSSAERLISPGSYSSSLSERVSSSIWGTHSSSPGIARVYVPPLALAPTTHSSSEARLGTRCSPLRSYTSQPLALCQELHLLQYLDGDGDGLVSPLHDGFCFFLWRELPS